MGKTFKKLKAEIRHLRTQLGEMKAEADMARREFASKHNLQPGDLVVFRTEHIGMSFGHGVAGMVNLEQKLSTIAGGKVLVMAVKPDRFTVENLTVGDQQALRKALDRLDEIRRQAPNRAPTPPARKEMVCPKCNTEWPEGSTTCFKPVGPADRWGQRGSCHGKLVPVTLAKTEPATKPAVVEAKPDPRKAEQDAIAKLALGVATGTHPGVVSKPYEEMNYSRCTYCGGDHASYRCPES